MKEAGEKQVDILAAVGVVIGEARELLDKQTALLAEVSAALEKMSGESKKAGPVREMERLDGWTDSAGLPVEGV